MTSDNENVFEDVLGKTLWEKNLSNTYSQKFQISENNNFLRDESQKNL